MGKVKQIDWVEVRRLSEGQGMSNRAIAKKLGVSESTIRRGKARIETSLALTSLGLDVPIVLDLDDSYAITADWHIPIYDRQYLKVFLDDAEKRGIRNLIIAGDFFNFDALSMFDPKQVDAGLEVELREAENVMSLLGKRFENIYYIWGNHDARLHKALGFALQFRESMRMVLGGLDKGVLSRIVFSNLDHLWIGDRKKSDSAWLVCHPNSYTRVPLSTARALSTKYECNIITAHSHHCAVGYGINGKNVVAEIGGLFDKDRTAYLQRTTNHPMWTQGYAFLVKGKLIVRSPGWEVG